MAEALDLIAEFRIAAGTRLGYERGRALIAALEREGLVVVPVEPTEEMLCAQYGSFNTDWRADARERWQAMLRASSNQESTDG